MYSIGILYGDLAWTPFVEILRGDIAYWSVAEILPRGLLQRSCQEISHRDIPRAFKLFRDLAKRPLIEILYRDVVKRTEILLRELILESLNRYLTLRSLTEILSANLYKGVTVLHSSFHRERVKDILRTIFYRDLCKGNLQNLSWNLWFMFLQHCLGFLAGNNYHPDSRHV